MSKSNIEKYRRIRARYGSKALKFVRAEIKDGSTLVQALNRWDKPEHNCPSKPYEINASRWSVR